MEKNARDKAIEIGETTLLGDLMKCVVQELKALQKPWSQTPENEQAEVIDRIELQLREAAEKAINVIACDNMPSLRAQVDKVVFKDGVQCVLKLGKSDPNVFDLAAHEGGVVRIIIPSNDTLINNEGKPVAEPDQRGLELGKEYTDGDDFDGSQESEEFDPPEFEEVDDPEDAVEEAPAEKDSLYDQAVELVTERQNCTISMVQRQLKIGYNRAARLVEQLEENGVVSEMAEGGTREVLINNDASQEETSEEE